MNLLTSGILIVSMFVLDAGAQIANYEVLDITDTSAIINWCDTNQRSSRSGVTIEAKAINPLVVAHSDGPRVVTGCKTTLEKLCHAQDYQVKLTNGSYQRIFKLTTAGGGITNMENSELQVTEVKNTSVKFVWKHAMCFSRDKSMYYKIETDEPRSLTVHSHEAIGDRCLNTTHDEYEKTGLKPWTDYKFFFSTCKRSGNQCSGSHHARIERTKAGKPSLPTSLETSVTGTSLELSWSAPSEPNGPIGGYMVYVDDWKPKEAKGMTWKEDNLQPNTEYEVSVAACNYEEEKKQICSERAWTSIQTGNDGTSSLKLVQKDVLCIFTLMSVALTWNWS